MPARPKDAEMVHCPWAPADDPVYRNYHDTEWGTPERDDRALFEKLILDGFQAGLSWRTILYKRDNFRRAFEGFNPAKIARYGPKHIERLLGDAGIVRSQSKIEATIGNARAYLDLMETRADGFSGFLWDFVGGEPIVNRWTDFRDAPTRTAESEAMSRELKRLGFKFCGPVIVYAFMQAVGMVNDHEIACPRHAATAKGQMRVKRL
ncbi:MAG: DNA-3-methyladenine glycosylase I [Alphaproteobacteria bacterium]|nr:DNA-3-methyladenine glycosylase I [Alphaproteobacteria bacterium]